MSENVIVLGASQKPERYSYKALKMLEEHGHSVAGVHPKLSEIEGTKVFPTIKQAAADFGSVDTVTLYVGPERLAPLVGEMIEISPKRVIMNPGTEDTEVRSKLESAGVDVQQACTLVLLSTGQY